MEDYYKILGISSAASLAEIKTAFRRKAKEFHPDVATDESCPDHEKFLLILKAYKVLTDSEQRCSFDATYQNRHFYDEKKSFDYREWLSKRTDEESRCKLVFFDLMHDREDEAVEEYKRLCSEKVDFSLSKWFTREDFMDFGYILAEELYFREEFYDAFFLLAKVIRMEYTFSYFKHFFVDVLAFAKNILKFHLAGIISDELALDAWEEALELHFPPKDEACFLRLMAESYFNLGDGDTARICLEEALKLDSKVVIPSRLKKSILENI